MSEFTDKLRKIVDEKTDYTKPETLMGPDLRGTAQDTALVETIKNLDEQGMVVTPKEEEPVEGTEEAEPTPPPSVEEEEVEVEETPTEPTEPLDITPEERRKLSDEDLDSMFALGKVNGKEVEISLRELLNTQQTFEATKERLEAAKEIQREYQQALTDLHTHRQAPERPFEAEPDFSMMTDQDKQIYDLQESVKGIRDMFQERELISLQSSEDSLIQERISANLGEVPMEQVSTLIQRVKQEDPYYGAVADDLFSKGPADNADVQRRVAFFDALLQKAKSLEMPTIIEKVKEEGKKEGKKEAVEKVKQNLVSTSGTDTPPTRTRADRIQDVVAAGGGRDGWAELFKTELIQKRRGGEI